MDYLLDMCSRFTSQSNFLIVATVYFAVLGYYFFKLMTKIHTSIRTIGKWVYRLNKNVDKSNDLLQKQLDTLVE